MDATLETTGQQRGCGCGASCTCGPDCSCCADGNCASHAPQDCASE